MEVNNLAEIAFVGRPWSSGLMNPDGSILVPPEVYSSSRVAPQSRSEEALHSQVDQFRTRQP